MTASKERLPDEIIHDFDTFYRKEKESLRRAIDKVFTKDAAQRYQLALRECKTAEGKKILAIGYGSTSVAIQLARKGAHIVGTGLSEDVLTTTKSIVEKEELHDRCTLMQDDFAKHVFNEKFDISLALEFFDYAEDSAFYLKKMRSLTTQKCIMSFPSKFAFQVPLRMIWLRSRNLPLCFYTKKELKQLLLPHFSHFTIKKTGAGFFCVGSV